MSTTTWTKTEAKRRLTVAAGLARRAIGQRAKNTRVEVGERICPTNTTFPPITAVEAAELCYGGETDDLRNMWFRDEYARIARPGDVLHLYVSEPTRPGDEPYLEDVVVVWLGHGVYEPRVIDTRFVKYEG
jgi:hypothetical protein